MTVLVRHENDPLGRLFIIRDRHHVEHQGPLGSREGCGAARPQDDLCLRQQTLGRHQVSEGFLIPVIAAGEDEGVPTPAAGSRRPGAGREGPDEVAHLVVDGPGIRQGTMTART